MTDAAPMTDAPPPAGREAPVARRVVSPALFAVVAICFFLPFVTIACDETANDLAGQIGEGFGATPLPTEAPGDTTIADFTGWQLVVGDEDELAATSDPAPAPGAPELGSVADVQPYAIAAFAAAVLGIALSWLALWVGPIAGSLLGIGGVVALFLLKGKVEGIFPTGSLGFAGGFGAELLEFRWQIPFWIAMAASGLAAAWSLFRLLAEARMRSASPRADMMRSEPAASPPAAGPGGTAAPPPTPPPAPPPPPE